jgi:hypothetical protein
VTAQSALTLVCIGFVVIGACAWFVERVASYLRAKNPQAFGNDAIHDAWREANGFEPIDRESAAKRELKAEVVENIAKYRRKQMRLVKTKGDVA